MKKPMVEAKAEPGVAAALQKHVADDVLPGWIKRCGERCATTYAQVIAPITGITYTAK